MNAQGYRPCLNQTGLLPGAGEGRKVKKTFLQHIQWHKPEQLAGTTCILRHCTPLDIEPGPSAALLGV